MERLFVNALNKKLKAGENVTGTNLEEGITLNEVRLNSPIAESLRTLNEVTSFGKGEISVVKDYIPVETEGYIYERDDVVIFLEYATDSRSREIESITVNKEEGEYPAYYVLQALILLELIADKSRLALKDKVMHFVNLPFIDKDSEDALAFATTVRTLENMVSEGVFDPYEETEVDDEIEVLPYQNLIDKLGLVKAVAPIETPVTTPEELLEETPVVSETETSVVLEEEKTETETETENAEQISLFDDETESKTETSTEAALVGSTVSSTVDSDDITAESVVLLVEAALKSGVRADDIAKTANVAPSTVYELKDLETLAKRGKNPRKSTLVKIADAVRTLHTSEEHIPTVSSSVSPIVSSETPSMIEEETKVVESPRKSGGILPSGIGNFFTEAVNVLKDIASSLKDIAISFKEGRSFLASSSQKVQKEVENKVIAFDLDQAKKLRPQFFDDTWVRSTLKEFEIEDGTIDDVIKFRKASRERLLKEHPEAIADVEPKFAYMGFTEPLETLVEAVLEDLNLLFKGEAGSGKTTLIQSGSCLLNLPLYTINGSDESNIETIVGFKELEQGNIIFVPGRLVKAMKIGGIFYPDEANMMRPNILAIINGALDHRRELYNEFVGERIKANPFFRFMASINEEYEDTRAMNRATLDRSIAMEMTYMTIEQLKNMLRKLDTETSERDIRMLAQIATALQQGVRDELISPEVASIRNIIYLQKMIKRTTFEKALKRIIDKYPREDRAAIIGVLSSVDRLNISALEILAS